VQVVHHGAAAQVEQVLAVAHVAGAAVLPVANVGQGVLDRHPLAQLGAPLGGELAGAQLGQQLLVGVDLHAASAGAGGALDAQGTGGADPCGELDLAARGERHLLAGGADQQAAVEVEGEVGLGEPGAVLDPPGLAEDLKVIGTV